MNYAILSLLFLGSAISAGSQPKSSDRSSSRSPIATRLIGAFIKKAASADNSPSSTPRADQEDEQPDALLITLAHLRQTSGESTLTHPATDEGKMPEHDFIKHLKDTIKEIEDMSVKSAITNNDNSHERKKKEIIAVKKQQLVRTTIAEATFLITKTQNKIQEFKSSSETSSTADTKIIDSSAAKSSSPKSADFEKLLGVVTIYKERLEAFLPQAPVQEKPAQVVHKPTIEE